VGQQRVIAAGPDEAGAWVAGLERELRSGWPDAFAGLAFMAGELRVFAKKDSGLVTAVATLARDAPAGLHVRVVAEATNSLLELESVRAEITRRMRAGELHEMRMSGWGVDVLANRVRVEVEEPTAALAAHLAAEFGQDRILLTKGKGAVALGGTP
jgi:hypothetical protein